MSARLAAAAGVVLLACVTAAWWGRASELRGADGGVTMKLLLDRISQLEMRVEKLEKRRPLVALPPQASRGPVPPGWRSFEFNGQRFFLVPLDATRTLTRPAAKDR